MVENARKSFHDNVFYNLLNKNEFKDYVQSDEKKIEDISSNIKSKKEYKIYEEKMKSVEKEEEFKRDRVLPKFMPFININKLQENQ